MHNTIQDTNHGSVSITTRPKHVRYDLLARTAWLAMLAGCLIGCMDGEDVLEQDIEAADQADLTASSDFATSATDDWPDTGSTESAALFDPAAQSRSIVSAVNAKRAQRQTCKKRLASGQVVTTSHAPVAALAENAKLRTAAIRHTKDMATNGFLSHTGSDGSSSSSRARDAGYNWRALGEAIAQNTRANPGVVASIWMNSDKGHCQAIMDGGYQDAGAQAAKARDGKIYWTIVFGRD